MTEKDINRYKHSTWMMIMVMIMATITMILAVLGKVTSEYNFALGLFIGYASNHTYQNYRTAPKD